MSSNSLRWIFNCHRWLPTKDEFLIGLSCVQKDERSRILSFYYKKDVKRALIGQLMLRRCVSDCLQIHYDSIEFKRTYRGKPVIPDQLKLTNGQPFDYNISHDGDFCVLAAESILKVGVDISRIREANLDSTDEYFQTMERVFSPQEWTFIKDHDLNNSSDQKPLHRFHRLWALKESFVKAEGIGVGYELRRIQFNCPTKYIPVNKVIFDTTVTHDAKLAKNWIFEESVIEDNHFISVALSGDGLKDFRQKSSNNLFQSVSFDQLIDPNVEISVSDDIWDSFNTKEMGKLD